MSEEAGLGQVEETVRRVYDVIKRSESADAVMAELEELTHPEIEFVNPEDAIEGGTRKRPGWDADGLGELLWRSRTRSDARD